VTLKIPKGECLAEVRLELRECTWVYGLPPEALGKLGEAIDALTAALRACDVHALASLARFPVVHREREAGSAGAGYFYAKEVPRAYASSRKLAESCNALVFDASAPRQPSVVGGGDAATLRILGASPIGPTYWDLRWVKDRWLLVGIETTSFE
jgi:hypothetical protein